MSAHSNSKLICVHRQQQLLRRVVAGPRQPHEDAKLDLCYVTDFPSHRNIWAFYYIFGQEESSYPSRAYRNPLDHLVRFLDAKHGSQWAIWEFRAEGTGYPDSEVYNRIWHYPWPDHHPPPFRILPLIVASMRDWLHPPNDAEDRHDAMASNDMEALGDMPSEPVGSGRVIVVHCKAGKGRSGTAGVSYLMSEEGWTKDAALQRFTERRMRPGFGTGVSIPSQLRYVDYMERWVNAGKIYVEQEVEVLEVQVWGLRDGVRIAVEGYLEVEGAWRIKTYHVFNKAERSDHGVDSRSSGYAGRDTGARGDVLRKGTLRVPQKASTDPAVYSTPTASTMSSKPSSNSNLAEDFSTSSLPRHPGDSTTPSISSSSRNVSFRPLAPILLPTSDINIATERRSHARYGVTMTTSVAHVWFNTFFEGNGPENYSKARSAAQGHTESNTPSNSLSSMPQENGTDVAKIPGTPWASSSGVFEIPWEDMDGIKGSSQRGVRAFDRIAVVWRVVNDAVAAFPSNANHKALSNTPETANTASDTHPGIIIEPDPGEPIADMSPTNPAGNESSNAFRADHGDGERDSDEDDNNGIRHGVVEDGYAGTESRMS